MTEPQRLRLFVALDLPGAAVDALARFRDAAADPAVWRPLDAATFHVTLAFLGHRTEADVGLVGEVLSGLEPRGPVALAVGDGLLLPPRRGRVPLMSSVTSEMVALVRRGSWSPFRSRWRSRRTRWCCIARVSDAAAPGTSHSSRGGCRVARG